MTNDQLLIDVGALFLFVGVILVIVGVILQRRQRRREVSHPADSAGLSESTLDFVVGDVFYIKPPVDRVIVVGVIKKGTVRVGQGVVVHSSTGKVQARVDGIEKFNAGEAQRAGEGEQVGLRLSGISKDQAAAGDLVRDR